MLFDYTNTVQHKFIFNVNVKVAETFLTLNTPVHSVKQCGNIPSSWMGICCC